MDRRILAGGLAGVAGAAIAAAPFVGGVSTFPSSGDVLLFVGGSVLAVAIPVTGVVLLARRRPEGVAVLVAAALIALPAIMSLGYLLVSSRTPGDETIIMTWHLATQLLLVAAGTIAWGLRDPDRWRWNRSVPAPFVALGIVALLPTGATFVAMHGVLFPLAMVTNLNLLDLALLAQLVVIAGLLLWAGRLPRRTAGVVVLVLLVPRLYESLAQASGLAEFGTAPEPLSWLGLAAEAALVATACWWLTRGDDLSTRTDGVDAGTPAAR